MSKRTSLTPPLAASGTPKRVGLTIRIASDKNKVFSALMALEGSTANEWVNAQIDEYIQRNKHLLKEAYEQLKTE